MSTGDTILAMTPIERENVTLFYWRCQRKQCRHKWIAKDVNNPPERCAKCKRKDWNRKTLPVGRPRTRKDEQRGPRKRRRK